MLSYRQQLTLATTPTSLTLPFKPDHESLKEER